MLKTLYHSVSYLGCVSSGRSGSGLVIQDLSGSWCIKGTGESMTRVDSPVPLMHRDPDDLGSLIRIWITTKERSQTADSLSLPRNLRVLWPLTCAKAPSSSKRDG